MMMIYDDDKSADDDFPIIIIIYFLPQLFSDKNLPQGVPSPLEPKLAEAAQGIPGCTFFNAKNIRDTCGIWNSYWMQFKAT